jgi:predicted component of viral defense system (DUF524 family)
MYNLAEQKYKLGDYVNVKYQDDFFTGIVWGVNYDTYYSNNTPQLRYTIKTYASVKDCYTENMLTLASETDIQRHIKTFEESVERMKSVVNAMKI